MGCTYFNPKSKCPGDSHYREVWGGVFAPLTNLRGFSFGRTIMAKEKVLSFEMEGQVGPDLLILRALGDAIAAIGVAGDMAALLDGTLVNLGYLIIEKVETVGEALGVL
jgi:hypothetical protein